MAIFLVRGQTINGRWVDANTLILGLSPAQEDSLVHGGSATLLPQAALPAALAGVQDVLEASLPAASAANTGVIYFVADRNGGTLLKSNGVSLVQLASGVSEGGESASIWASRGAGSVIGERKRISDLGNNPLVETQWNGSRWVPRGGRQLIYELGAPIVSPSGTGQVCTLPNVTIPGGLLGLTGSLEIELAWELGAGTPLTRVVAMGWGGSSIVDDSATLHRRFALRRTVRNTGVANAQQVLERQADYATYQSINTTGQQKTKDTAADVVIDGSVTSSFGSAATAAVMEYRVWWVGVGA